MNLMYLAQGGLSSAQSALNVVGNNINNALTLGYSRQSIILGEAGGKTTNYGFFGYGVQVNGVQRAYDGFINNQVRGAAAEFQAISSRFQQASQIDDMYGDSTNNISVAFGNIFESMQKMSSDPVNLASRQETYSQFNTISYKFQSDSKTLDGLEKSTNTQIKQSVDDINDCANQIANLNSQIEKIYWQTGNVPADLLDQRDLLLDKLSGQVGIRVNENPTTGRVDVTLTNGLTLVNGDKAYALEATPSPANPNRLEVAYIDASGNAMLLDENKFTEGNLGGLFKFRNEDLVSARNDLNQLALQMANEFNTVNAQGYDLYGNPGGNIFNIADPVALANRNNSSDVALGVSYTNISEVNATDYTLVFKGPDESDWQITTSDGRTITPEIGDDGELIFEGISVMPSGVPEPGDSFLLNPLSGAAAGISVALTDGSQIAASSSSDVEDESNNENLQALLAVKDKRIIGKATFSEAYANMVSSVGSTVSGLKAEGTTSGKVFEQWAYQKQAVSGVDINEEYINMTMFSQYYQANAQVLQAAITIFDTILSIR
ncbi:MULTISPECIES: flagellar hook-associated protein FlgK [Yersinia]|jgi:flagellar hook-associated protein 1 FlgK|uniref:Flagellar hook-associated protein 1 n=2 Tax=Yersinia TaxID=629 RepID=A0AAI9EPQ7_YERFR|nr:MULTISPECIES: flagellar hook-associated protein FlgK [Yersinia]HEI6967167.1 flagellar hook-associated protein FlgK [Yersinia enterocolitica]AVX36858.1 flagellar hook-associated protein FlgK [Yersinia massiliensis]MDN0127524.1 flagellar hook-associated protein FlgK [Yersinia massiliensis]QKJ11662.1 flagellar hook-associated protein FlgK [Yersinia massiliensis]CFR02829.1 flagellar hook-associated protein FlgK [Yersinia frederiksenii]